MRDVSLNFAFTCISLINLSCSLSEQFRITKVHRMIQAKVAANGTSFVKVPRNFWGIIAALAYLACEWLLIVLLLADAVFSYLLTKFAHYCELQIPCILCSRLDRVLGNEKPGFYRSLLCLNHRSEISSLVSCHIHGMLADGHGMCEECLMSFAIKIKPNPDMNGLVVGESGINLGACDFQSSLLNGEFIPSSVDMRLCSCCSKPLRSRLNAHRMLQQKYQQINAWADEVLPNGVIVGEMTKPPFEFKDKSWTNGLDIPDEPCEGPSSPLPNNQMTKPNISLPRLLPNRKLKKTSERIPGFATSHSPGENAYDALSHGGTINFLTDDDWDSPDEETSLPLPNNQITKPNTEHNISLPRLLPYQENLKKMSERLSGIAISHSLGENAYDSLSHLGYTELKLNSDSDSEFLDDDNAFTVVSRMKEPKFLNASEFTSKKTPMALQKPTRHSSEPCFQQNAKNPHDAKYVGSDSETGWQQKNNIYSSATAGIIFTDNFRSLPDVVEAPHGLPIKHQHKFGSYQEANPFVPSEPIYPLDPHSSINFIEGPTDALQKKLHGTGTAKGRNVPIHEHKEALVLESVTEPTYVNPRNASSQEVSSASNNAIPSMQGHTDESNGAQMFQYSIPWERTSSSIGYLNGSLVGEIEGESIIDQLKRQVEYDRKCINALHKELEEERSASAISANEAMAMITRLQEEKAALRTEALQYLRMMEEQEEHDLEALDKANDLLAEREKEIMDLEAELEYFKLNFPDAIPEENHDLGEEDMIVRDTDKLYMNDDVDAAAGTTLESIAVKSLWSEFDDEKLFISRHLKSLERKLYQFASEEASPHMSNGDIPEERADIHTSDGETINDKTAQMDDRMKESSPSIHGDFLVSDVSVPAREESNAVIGKDQSLGSESGHQVPNGLKPSKQYKNHELFTLKNEILDLNERLVALENDWNFLEHAFNSLQWGKDGLHFVQEISNQLLGLRKIVTSGGQPIS